MEEKTQSQSQQPQRVINVNLPATYTNSINIGLSVSDIALTLMNNGRPFQILNMSYSTAKGLAEMLTGAIKKYETETNSKVVTGREAATMLKK